MQDAFGVERGIISKAGDKAKSQRMTSAAIGAVPFAGGYASPIYAGVKAKEGRKAAVAGRTLGRNMVQGAAGSVPGVALMAVGMKKGNLGMARAGKYAAMGGGLAGQSHASYAAMRNAQRRGDVE